MGAFLRDLSAGRPMNQQWKAILISKRRERERLAALPFSEKVALLDKLRDRALAAAESPLARAHEPNGGRAWIFRDRPPPDRP